MTQIVLLDSTPVGLITNPKATPLAVECQQWLRSLLDRGYSVVLPMQETGKISKVVLILGRSLNRSIGSDFKKTDKGIKLLVQVDFCDFCGG